MMGPYPYQDIIITPQCRFKKKNPADGGLFCFFGGVASTPELGVLSPPSIDRYNRNFHVLLLWAIRNPLFAYYCLALLAFLALSCGFGFRSPICSRCHCSFFYASGPLLVVFFPLGSVSDDLVLARREEGEK